MRDVGVIGTGPSALYLLKALVECPRRLSITFYEAGRRPGVGTPYNPETTPRELLANIASIEIPPLVVTLEEWLRSQDDGRLAALGVARREISDRAFFPRVALGAYFHDQFGRLVARGAARGHDIAVLTRHRVMDVAPMADHAVVVAAGPDTMHHSESFARVVIATGHHVRASPPFDYHRLSRDTFARASHEGTLRLGILGSSLSAIDIAVAAAAALGRFEPADDTLRYRLDNPGQRMAITMMSRGGLLPEADFYCPIPYQPLRIFTPEAAQELVALSPPKEMLDRAFDLFRRELAIEDPAYAERIRLDDLSADNFAEAYFRDRVEHDPFDWARRNLAEALAGHAARRTSPWRYAILRMHEVFALILPRLPRPDLARFNRGLKRMFVDSYAAVPPQSIARLLALRDARALEIVRLGKRYTLNATGDDGAELVSGGTSRRFDVMADATGQDAAGDRAFPFPSLRLAMMANRMSGPDGAEGDAPVGAAFEMLGRLNGIAHIHCLAIPFLIQRRPFIQGVMEAAAMGRAVGEAIVGSWRTDKPDDAESLRRLASEVTQTKPLYRLDVGAVVVTPKPGG